MTRQATASGTETEESGRDRGDTRPGEEEGPEPGEVARDADPHAIHVPKRAC